VWPVFRGGNDARKSVVSWEMAVSCSRSIWVSCCESHVSITITFLGETRLSRMGRAVAGDGRSCLLLKGVAFVDDWLRWLFKGVLFEGV